MSARCSQICCLRFRSREDNYTEQLACNLSRYPRELVLCGPDLFFDPLDHDKLDAHMDTYFTPCNLRIHLTAPAAEMPGVGDPTAWEASCEKEEWWAPSCCPATACTSSLTKSPRPHIFAHSELKSGLCPHPQVRNLFLAGALPCGASCGMGRPFSALRPRAEAASRKRVCAGPGRAQGARGALSNASQGA